MYLIQAPKSKLYGYGQPRFYIKVNKEFNYSAMDKYKSEGGKAKKRPTGDYVITKYDKLRLTFFRNKRKEIMDSIDGSDFTFAKLNKTKQVNYVSRENDDKNKSLWDSLPYGCAYGTSLNMLSECKLDLKMTPFNID